MTEQPEQQLPEESVENASKESPVPESGTDSISEAKQGWHAPSGEASSPKHDEWYVPENAATLEQLEALQTSFRLEAPAKLDLGDVPSKPEKTGTWYLPQDGPDEEVVTETPEAVNDLPDASEELPLSGTQLIRQASSIGDILDQDAFRTSMDDADTGFREAPAIESEVADDFVPAPDVPLSSSLEGGLGGLRDEPAPTVEGTGESESLSPEDIAALYDGESQPVEVPAKGFGGVQDQLAASPRASDTGPMPSADAGQVPLAEPTPTFQEVPQMPQQPQPSPSSASPSQSQPVPSQQSQEGVGQRFRDVENAVQTLRQQFAQGRITRGQLEAELRRLMVLDDQGRWWTLGVDSSRWYRYDGREWIPDAPPQTGAQVVVGAPRNFVPTETNVQPSISPSGDPSIPGGGDISMQPGGVPKIALDEYGMPLPQRVPQEDPGATLVNLNAQELVATGSEPTLAKIDTGGRAPASMEAETIHPAGAGQMSPSDAAQTVVEMAQDAEDELYDYSSPDGELSDDRKKKPEEGGLQPDYSEAFGKPLNRSGVVKFGIWASVLGVVAGLGMTLCVLLSMVGYYFYTVNDYSDAISALPDRASTFQTTTIYANDGTTVLAEYDDPSRGIRQKVTLEEVSPWMIHAIVSTEDETFYENPGFSVFAIGRAMYTNILGGGPRSGASTITQQLARRLLLNEEFATDVSAERKVTEIILAAEISRQYTKTEILELYLNEMSFGNRAIGIEAASQIYFQKSAWELNVYEAAYLAGLLQAPGYYTPNNRDEFGEPFSLGRMDTVLRLMMESNGDGCVDMQHQFTSNASFGANIEAQPELLQDVYDAVYGRWPTESVLCLTPRYLTESIEIINRGRLEQRIRTFQPPVRDVRNAHFVNWVWDELVATYGEEYIYNTGLEVITTLDPAIQNEAQTAVNEQIAAWGVVNNGSVIAIDPRTGAVLAMVGSADFNNETIDGQVNVAFSPQQPGSSIKPLVYLTTFIGRQEDGDFVDYLTPSSILWDTVTQPLHEAVPGYVVENYDGEFRGPISVRNALSNSLNVPAVKALRFVGTDRFTEVARDMHIDFPLETPVEAGLPAALGGVDVELFDMVAAYAAFGNGGVRNEPFGILGVTTIEGEGVYAFSTTGIPESDRDQVIDPGLAFLVSHITSDSNARAAEFGGPPTRLDVFIDGQDFNASAKTGTTNDNRDAWTIGWTPNIVVGVWMGNTDNTPMGSAATGFSLAAPVWNRVMVTSLRGTDPVNFQQPSNVTQATVCRDTGALPPNGDASQCGVGGSYVEFFLDARPPKSATETTVQAILVDPFTNRIANEFCNYGDDLLTRNYLSVDDPTIAVWLQSSQGQNWAAQRSIDVNTIGGTLPTEECQPGQPAPVATVTTPANGSVASARVEFRGQAIVPNFSRYELQFAALNDPNSFTTLAGQGSNFSAESPDSPLALWDSTQLPDGQYYFRIVVYSDTNVGKQSNQILLTISNTQSPTEPTEPATGDGTDTETDDDRTEPATSPG